MDGTHKPQQELVETDQKREPLPTSQPPNEGALLMQLVAELVRDKEMDLERFKQIVKLRDEFKAQEAKRIFDADFVQMKPNLPLVIKTHANSQTSSNYAKLEDVNQKIDPVLSQFGFGTSSKVTAQTDTDVTMVLELRHRSGHAETMTLTMPIDDAGAKGNVNKTKLHAISSTITYIKRVGFCALLNISTGDDKDGNGVKKKGSPITTEEAVDIDTRARNLGEKYHAKFLTWLGVATANEVVATDYKKAIDALDEAEHAKKAREQKAKATGA
jgi:ERF superfamily